MKLIHSLKCIQMRARVEKVDVLGWTKSKAAQGQVLKSSKGKNDEEIPEPSFLADTSHSVKVVTKNIFSIVNKSRAQKCGCTKADAL